MSAYGRIATTEGVCYGVYGVSVGNVAHKYLIFVDCPPLATVRPCVLLYPIPVEENIEGGFYVTLKLDHKPTFAIYLLLYGFVVKFRSHLLLERGALLDLELYLVAVEYNITPTSLG